MSDDLQQYYRTEYHRRNMQVARVCGAKAAVDQALDRALTVKRMPVWLIAYLESAASRLPGLQHDLAAWRDLAADAPAHLNVLTPPADLVQAKDAEIARLRADLEAMTALKRNYAEMKDAAELREAQARAQERARIVGILSSLPPAAFFPGCVSNLLAALTPPSDPAAKIGGE